jgi:hypothetical protein
MDTQTKFAILAMVPERQQTKIKLITCDIVILKSDSVAIISKAPMFNMAAFYLTWRLPT